MNKIDDDRLETMIDNFGVRGVLDQIVIVCWEKADYLACTLRDGDRAKDWEVSARRIDKVIGEVIDDS